MRHGVPIPSRIRSLGNVVSSPAGSGAELQPKTNLVTLLLLVLYRLMIIMLMIQMCKFYTRELNKKVSYRKSRASIRVAKLFGQGRWRGRLCNN